MTLDKITSDYEKLDKIRVQLAQAYSQGEHILCKKLSSQIDAIQLRHWRAGLSVHCLLNDKPYIAPRTMVIKYNQ